MGFFDRFVGGNERDPEQAIDVRVATCAVLVEIASSDDEFSTTERERILQLVSAEFGLSREEAEELEAAAKQALDGSIDRFRFTNTINQHYSSQDRERVVEMLWKVVYADGVLDPHEDFVIHKLGKLLRLSHRQLIDAKLRVIHHDK